MPSGGCSHLDMGSNHYTWKKLPITINSVFIGKMWIDSFGDVEITNHTTKEKCYIKFYQSINATKERKVVGHVVDAYNIVRYELRGSWGEKIECAPVVVPDSYSKSMKFTTGKSKTLWQRKLPP